MGIAPEAVGGIAAAAAAAPFLTSAFSSPSPPPQAPAQPASMYAPEPPALPPEPPAPAQPRSAYEPPPPEPMQIQANKWGWTGESSPPPPPPPQYQTGIEGESQLATYSSEPQRQNSPYAQFDESGMDYSTPAPEPIRGGGGIGSLLKNYSNEWGGGLGNNFEELSDWMQYQ